MKVKILTLLGLFVSLLSCTTKESMPTKIKLITLDPGHFHAALVQKSMYPDIDSMVHVYAPDGEDVQQHLARIEQYNSREENATSWKSTVYTGPDFFEKMLQNKEGNVVVLAGNNEKKTEYILEAIKAGFHVLADKPMAINKEDYALLLEAFDLAQKKNLLLYDIMTERSEITTILQKELSQIPELFGELEIGSPEKPAVTKESVHHFFKYVSGKPLIRPAWFFDTKQQGEGIVDVTTHLVDLSFWECFPNKILGTEEISIVSAKRWPTVLNQKQFKQVTGLDAFPDFLSISLNGENLESYANGEINYTIGGHHAKVSVIWNFQAPEGTGDTHYSIMRGTKVNLVIKQGAEQNFKPILYIEPLEEMDEKLAHNAIKRISETYPGISLEAMENGWKVVVPEKYDIGHEAHFAQVMERFINFYKAGKLPEWETPNMKTKYYLTTTALEEALK